MHAPMLALVGLFVVLVGEGVWAWPVSNNITWVAGEQGDLYNTYVLGVRPCGCAAVPGAAWPPPHVLRAFERNNTHTWPGQLMAADAFVSASDVIAMCSNHKKEHRVVVDPTIWAPAPAAGTVVNGRVIGGCGNYTCSDTTCDIQNDGAMREWLTGTDEAKAEIMRRTGWTHEQFMTNVDSVVIILAGGLGCDVAAGSIGITLGVEHLTPPRTYYPYSYPPSLHYGRVIIGPFFGLGSTSWPTVPSLAQKRTFVNAVVHELGHNMGMQHSGNLSSPGEYDDISSMMAYAHASVSCPGPYQVFQAGWTSGVRWWNPLDNATSSCITRYMPISQRDDMADVIDRRAWMANMTSDNGGGIAPFLFMAAKASCPTGEWEKRFGMGGCTATSTRVVSVLVQEVKRRTWPTDGNFTYFFSPRWMGSEPYSANDYIDTAPMFGNRPMHRAEARFKGPVVRVAADLTLQVLNFTGTRTAPEQAQVQLCRHWA